MIIKNLSFLYRTTMASIPLLELAVRKSDGELKNYYQKHIDEETGHLEMLAADLLALGVTDIDRFHAAALFSGSQYYLLEHDHPAIFLGYMHLLESNAPKPEFVDKWESDVGIPLTCLRHHAVHDPEHAREIEALIEAQPLEIRNLIQWNEDNCAYLLRGVFQDMRNGNSTH